MKHASSFWLTVLAACLCLNTTMRGQTVSHTDDGEVSISLRDSSSDDLSASVVAQPQQPIRQAQNEVFVNEPFIQNPVILDNEVGFASTTNIDQVLYRVGSTSLDLYGVPSGHTNFQAFIPMFVEGNRALWFLTPRANITNEGSGGANIGFGRRIYVPNEDRVYGASFWYDFEGAHSENYHSLGGSFESLGRYFSLRANFDLIVGSENGVNGTQVVGDPTFSGNNIVFTQRFFENQALDEYNIEASVPMPIIGDYGVDVGVGMYYLNGESLNTPGFSLRGQAQITEDLFVNAIFTTDDIYDSNVSLNFEYTLPNGSLVPSRLFRRKPVTEMLTQSVMRRYRVPVADSIRDELTTAINPKTGQAYQVAHIDPNQGTTGTGTVGNPYMSLAEYESLPLAARSAYDVIFVSPRTDLTDTNLNTGIELLSGQRLLSSAVQHHFQSSGTVFRFPGFVSGDPLPFLTSTGIVGNGPVVTLEDGGTCFEVSGFQISREMTLTSMTGSGSGIFGNNVSEVSINRNILENAEYGAQLTNYSGSLHFSENVLRNNITGGMQVEYTGDGQLGLFSNTATNNMGSGFEIIVDGVNVTASNLPTVLPTVPDATNPTFSDGTAFSDPTGAPTNTSDTFPFDPATMSKGIAGNVADLNETGMTLEVINAGTFSGSVVNNSFSNNQDAASGGFVAHALDGSIINFDVFTGNTFDSNIGNGAILCAIDGGTINTPLIPDPLDPLTLIPGFTGNTFSNNERNGLAIIVDNSTLNDLAIGGNTFESNGESGMVSYLSNSTFNDWNITNNLFNTNGRDGLAFVMDNSTSTSVVVSQNAMTNNGGNGMNVIGMMSTIDDLLIENNVMTGNGAPVSGFNIDVVFLGGLTPAQQANFNLAAARWESMIVGDLPDVTDPTYGLIDDLLITAEGLDIGGGILGQATFTQQRTDTAALPYLGLMEFDSGFLASSTNIELQDVIIHEMGHVLGFGTLWNQKGFLDMPNALFTGPAATAEHNALFGLTDAGVPVENDTGSPGSDFSHWEDAIYGDELMTYSATGMAPRKITRVTAAQFQDLGYTVDLSAADQTFPIVPGSPSTTTTSYVSNTEPSAATIMTNSQKLQSFMLASSTLPLDDPAVVQQTAVGGNSGLQFELTDSVVNTTMRDNVIDANLASNVRAELIGASTLNLTSSRDTFNGSTAGNGWNVITRDNSIAMIDLQNATIMDNQQNGFRGETFNASTLGLSITSPTDPLFPGITTISGNGQNGVSVISSPDAPSANTSMVNVLIDETTITGNGARGVNMEATEMATFGQIRIQNSSIISNGADGIGMARSNDGFIYGVILDNTISGNGADGIDLLAQNANMIDTYLIQGNMIVSNTVGIDMRVEADAIINSTINMNLIQQNSSDGIRVTDRANSGLDQRYVTGVWTQNQILSNGGNGILLNASYGLGPVLQIGMNGTDVSGASLGNVIDGNTGWGIQSVFADGAANIENNEITNNMAGGINIASSLGGNSIDIDNNMISANNGTGVELLAEGVSTLISTVTNNTISGNMGDGDGIELAALDLSNATVTIGTNLIFDNEGRGVDILNAGSADSIVNLNNNQITVNGEEGVYVVNTASNSQYASKDAAAPNTNPLNDPTHGMDATGSIFADPTLVFNMDMNIVNNNGVLSAFPATGLVMRVGTSDGGFGTTFDGGYASDGLGGVVATVTNNEFSGNFGTDVWFESFTSTVDPPVTGGTWDDMNFGPQNYRSDPLARLDLVFTGNMGNSIDVTNTGAWYDNAEPVFKSRLNNIMAPNIAGPFQDASRRRNAQRLASRVDARTLLTLPPLVGPGLTYLYPGMGTSTFRVSAASTIGFPLSGASNEFQVIGSDFNSGAVIDIPSTFGELFFDWDTF